MKRLVGLLSAVLGISVLVVAGCAPNAATPKPAPTSTPASAVPSLSPEDAAWAKAVDAAKKEGKVTIYSYDFPGDIGLAMQSAFQNRYGINAEIITGRGAEFLERVKTEKRMGNMVADLTEGSTLHVPHL